MPFCTVTQYPNRALVIFGVWSFGSPSSNLLTIEEASDVSWLVTEPSASPSMNVSALILTHFHVPDHGCDHVLIKYHKLTVNGIMFRNKLGL